MKKKLFCCLLFILPLAALVLETFSSGVLLHFRADSPEGGIVYIEQTYSYFSRTPFFYACFSPLITGAFTCGVVLFSALNIFIDKKWVKITLAVFSTLTFLAALSQVVFWIESVSVIGGIVFTLLTAEVLLSQLTPQER